MDIQFLDFSPSWLLWITFVLPISHSNIMSRTEYNSYQIRYCRERSLLCWGLWWWWILFIYRKYIVLDDVLGWRFWTGFSIRFGSGRVWLSSVPSGRWRPPESNSRNSVGHSCGPALDKTRVTEDFQWEGDKDTFTLWTLEKIKRIISRWYILWKGWD